MAQAGRVMTGGDPQPILHSGAWRADDGDMGRCTWLWDPDLPLEVTLLFPADGDPVVWRLCRRLLIAGLSAYPTDNDRDGLVLPDPVGDGDVVLWSAHVWLHMLLRPPTGQPPLFLHFAHAPVKRFVEKTLAQVPVGAERVRTPDVLPAWLLQRYAS